MTEVLGLDIAIIGWLINALMAMRSIMKGKGDPMYDECEEFILMVGCIPFLVPVIYFFINRGSNKRLKEVSNLIFQAVLGLAVLVYIAITIHNHAFS